MLLAVGIGMLVVEAGVAAAHFHRLNDAARDAAAAGLDCPPGDVSIGLPSGGDSYDDFQVTGCGRRGLVTCTADVDCRFQLPVDDASSR